ncbi:MAG: hypothetical protein LBB76_12525 [Azoarcus sp.]|jgi:hypothetical protein|nr:hypothetical protein [Azoarcus sp.]
MPIKLLRERNLTYSQFLQQIEENTVSTSAASLRKRACLTETSMNLIFENSSPNLVEADFEYLSKIIGGRRLVVEVMRD